MFGSIGFKYPRKSGNRNADWNKFKALLDSPHEGALGEVGVDNSDQRELWMEPCAMMKTR